MIKLKNLLTELYVINIDDVRDNKEVKTSIDTIGFNKTNQLVNEIVNNLLKLNGVSCYRIISIPNNIDPVKLNKLGIHWSLDRESCIKFMKDEDEFHIYENDVLCLYKAKISINHINFEETIEKKFWYINEKTENIEKEVTMKENSNIFVYECYKWNQHDPISTIPLSINDYRVC